MLKTKRIGTIIGAGTIIDGDITCEGDMVRIDGKVNGNIKCDGILVVAKEGAIVGNVAAEGLSLSGSIKGDVTVREKVDIYSGADLHGDVESKGIAIEDNAVFVGQHKVTPESEQESEAVAGDKSDK